MAETAGPARRGRLDFVDALRGIAAFYVFAFHLSANPSLAAPLPGWADRLVRYGYSGVTLFFVASAFTLCYTVRARAGEPGVTARFYARRIFRIVPLYYAWLLIMLVLDRLAFGHPHGKFETALCLGFGFNFVPRFQEGIVWASWTLGVEMVFYAIFPLVYRFANDLRRSLAFLLASITVAAAYSHAMRSLHGPYSDPRFLDMSFLMRLPVFAVGMVAYFAYERWVEPREVPRRWGTAILVASALALAAIISLRPRVPAYVPLGGFAYAGLLMGLSIHPVKVLVNRATLFLGQISYSFYLNHPVMISAFLLSGSAGLIYATSLPRWIKLATSLVAVAIPLTCLSWLTYKLIEQPGIKAGSRLIRRLGEPRKVEVEVPKKLAVESPA